MPDSIFNLFTVFYTKGTNSQRHRNAQLTQLG